MTNDQIRNIMSKIKTTGTEKTYDALCQIVPDFVHHISYQQFYMATFPLREKAIAEAKEASDECQSHEWSRRTINSIECKHCGKVAKKGDPDRTYERNTF